MQRSEQSRFFYQNNNVQAVFQEGHVTTFFKSHHGCLAECCDSDAVEGVKLLATDMQASPLCEIDRANVQAGSYTPYGLEAFLTLQTGFSGQLKAKRLQGYFLGNGYRFYSTTLMRFYSPDSLSPFSIGDINSYVYCGGDPVNFTDRSGHMKRAQPSIALVRERSRSRSPQRLPGSSQADARRSQSRSPSPDSVLELMVANPGWEDVPSTHGTPSTRRAGSQVVQSQALPVTVPALRIYGDNSTSTKQVVKNNLKNAVKALNNQSLPAGSNVTSEHPQEVVKAIRSTLENFMKSADSVADPSRGLTFNNMVNALAVVSTRSSQ